MHDHVVNDGLDDDFERRITEKIEEIRASDPTQAEDEPLDVDVELPQTSGGGAADPAGAALAIGAASSSPPPSPSSALPGGPPSTATTPPATSAPAPTAVRLPRLVIGSEVEMAKGVVHWLSAQHPRPPTSAKGEVFTYSSAKGAWTAEREHVLRKVAIKYDGTPYGKKLIMRLGKAKIDGVITCVHHILAEPEYFDVPVDGFAFANGFAVVGSGGVTLLPHSPEHRATISQPFDYDPAAKRRAWETFLDDVFLHDADKAEKIDLLQEFIGACLIGIAPRYEKVLLLVGAGSNGKSILVEVIISLFPPSALTSVPPQSWGQDYKKATFAHALLNAVSEVPERAILDSNDFKAIVTGEQVEARHPYGRVFFFRSRAGHLFLANRLPATSDQTHGFWRRFMLLGFNRRYDAGGTASKDGKVAVAAERSVLLASLKAELPGIWAWALDGAARLLARGYFKLPASHDDLMRQWRRTVDQVEEFIATCCVPAASPSDWTGASVLYHLYRTWAQEAGHKNVRTLKSFCMTLRERVEQKHTNKASTYALTVLDHDRWEVDGP